MVFLVKPAFMYFKAGGVVRINLVLFGKQSCDDTCNETGTNSSKPKDFYTGIILPD